MLQSEDNVQTSSAPQESAAECTETAQRTPRAEGRSRLARMEGELRDVMAARNRAELLAGNWKGLARQLRTIAQESVDLMRLVLRATDVRPLPGVYFLLEDRGDLLYVGKSDNVLFRMAGHKDKGVAAVKMIHLPEAADRDKLEARFIHVMEPPLNVALTAFNKTKNLMDWGRMDLPQELPLLSPDALFKL